MTITSKSLILLFLLGTLSNPVFAQSTVHNVYGNVYNTDGTPLVGVEVVAFLNGSGRGSFTTQGYDAEYVSYFNVDVNGIVEESGLVISFTVNDVPAVQSVVFTPQASTRLNLTLATPISDYVPATTTSTATLIPPTTSSTTVRVQDNPLYPAETTSVQATTVPATTTIVVESMTTTTTTRMRGEPAESISSTTVLLRKESSTSTVGVAKEEKSGDYPSLPRVYLLYAAAGVLVLFVLMAIVVFVVLFALKKTG